MSLVAARKPKAYQRKKHGSHHSHTPRYLKTYWPYIPIFLILLSGFAINRYYSLNNGVLGASEDYSLATLLQETNSYRNQDKENPLRINSELDQAAQTKAQDMVNKNYWSHTSPSGQTPWNFIVNSGYEYQKAGENLAYGFSSAQDVVKAWMNSPDHRANVLNNDYEDVGFGVAQSKNYLGTGPKTIVVAEYAEPIIAVPTTGTFNQNAVLASSNSQGVSRLQLLTSPGVFWSVLALTALAGAGAAILIVNHTIALKKLLRKGELLILRHPALDILAVFIITYGVVLTRNAGFIK
jgi:uncharacterized protein YkwD